MSVALIELIIFMIGFLSGAASAMVVTYFSEHEDDMHDDNDMYL